VRLPRSRGQVSRKRDDLTSSLAFGAPAVERKRLGIVSRDLQFEWPDLSAVEELGFDTETTGRDLYGKDVPVGFSVYASEPGIEKSWYFPFDHAQGSNLDPDKCRAWARDNLASKKLVMSEAKFDLHMMRKWGVDLEKLGVKPEDAQFDCALLDSRRRSYRLEDMASDFLGLHKVMLPAGLKICEMSPADVDWYARTDAELALKLKRHFAPKIAAEELGSVRKLENDLIWSTCHMEREGLVVDVERLEYVRRQCVARYQWYVLQLEGLLGWRCIPTKRAHMELMYRKLGLQVNRTNPTQRHADGMASFTVEEMEKYWHPKWVPPERALLPVKLATQAIQVDSFRSKFADKYALATGPDGVIRFRLHQLKAESGDGDEGGSQKGTVTGRYSASGGSGKDGARKGFNPQQIYKVKEQAAVEAISDLLIREVFPAPEGMKFWTADASQIEYRIFGHYANSPSVTQVYQRDPWADFHDVVAEMTGTDRDRVAKHANFAALFGAGLDKFAYMIDMSVSEARPIYKHYHRMFPEIRPLHEDAMALAERRGYIKTLLGRRRRFGKGVDDKYHAALNAAIQGTAGDINKLTVLDLYNNREDLGIDLRLTFHDEELGYGALETERECLKLWEFLNEQRLKTSVPILWNLSVGKDWVQRDPFFETKKGKAYCNERS
jgi:DNA polymerase I-like protein with 3'-5' exonuclease and polymerase domains